LAGYPASPSQKALTTSPAQRCAKVFCGVDHQLFGTDFPMANESMVERVIHSIDEMDVTNAEKHKIFADNVRSLLKLT
jgi:predicted TIM-barrel fold metal-dependent hydrolase